MIDRPVSFFGNFLPFCFIFPVLCRGSAAPRTFCCCCCRCQCWFSGPQSWRRSTCSWCWRAACGRIQPAHGTDIGEPAGVINYEKNYSFQRKMIKFLEKNVLIFKNNFPTTPFQALRHPLSYRMEFSSAKIQNELHENCFPLLFFSNKKHVKITLSPLKIGGINQKSVIFYYY